MKRNKILFIILSLILCFGCSEKESKDINVFIAASLNNAVTELAQEYMEENSDVNIVINADSSGKLASQIKEGYDCDIFFSAAQDKMEGLDIADNSLKDLLKNKLVVVSRKDSNTEVTGLKDIGKAKSIALAGGTVPAGAYTRNALIALGMLPESDDVSAISSAQVSEALGGVEINECDNVSKVLIAVAEGACEVGTVYYSDTYGYEDKLDTLQNEFKISVSREMSEEVQNMCNLSTGVYSKGYDSGLSAGKMAQAKETAYRLCDKVMSVEEIADMVKVSMDTLRLWLEEREGMLVK